MDPNEAERAETEHLGNANRRRLLDLAVDYHKLANRLHTLEDHFDTGGIIEQMLETQAKLAFELEALKTAWSNCHGATDISGLAKERGNE